MVYEFLLNSLWVVCLDINHNDPVSYSILHMENGAYIMMEPKYCFSARATHTTTTVSLWAHKLFAKWVPEPVYPVWQTRDCQGSRFDLLLLCLKWLRTPIVSVVYIWGEFYALYPTNHAHVIMLPTFFVLALKYWMIYVKYLSIPNSILAAVSSK